MFFKVSPPTAFLARVLPGVLFQFVSFMKLNMPSV